MGDILGGTPEQVRDTAEKTAARQDQAGRSVVHEFTTGLELNKIAIG